MRLINADKLKQYISDTIKKQKGRKIDFVPIEELPIVIDMQPTVSDKEIRNKAIDEFAKVLLKQSVVDKSVVRRVAEQIK